MGELRGFCQGDTASVLPAAINPFACAREINKLAGLSAEGRKFKHHPHHIDDFALDERSKG